MVHIYSFFLSFFFFQKRLFFATRPHAFVRSVAIRIALGRVRGCDLGFDLFRVYIRMRFDAPRAGGEARARARAGARARRTVPHGVGGAGGGERGAWEGSGGSSLRRGERSDLERSRAAAAPTQAPLQRDPDRGRLPSRTRSFRAAAEWVGGVGAGVGSRCAAWRTRRAWAARWRRAAARVAAWSFRSSAAARPCSRSGARSVETRSWSRRRSSSACQRGIRASATRR